MKKLLQSFQITLSFFTTIPVVKHYEWTKDKIRFIPMMLPVIGGLLGGIVFSILWLLEKTPLSSFSISLIMVLTMLMATGGLHHDGLMDVSDALFSRSTTIDRRLEIMKDSRVGAFGVISLVAYIGILWITFYEIIGQVNNLIFIMIPIISRIMTGLMFYYFPYARKNSMATMFGEAIVKKDLVTIFSYIMACSLLLFNILGGGGLILMGLSIICFALYRRFVIKTFGGITGDLQGTFILLLELLLFITVGIMTYI